MSKPKGSRSELRNQPLYIRLLNAVAREGKTAGQIAAELGVLRNAVYLALRRMHGRIVYIERYVASAKGLPTAVWRMGTEPDMPAPAAVLARPDQRTPKPATEVVSFIVLIEAMMNVPTGMRELIQVSGCQRFTILQMLRIGRSLGVIHIGAWDRVRPNGAWAPQYAVAVDRPDAPKPKPLSRAQASARYNEAQNARRRQVRILKALSANNPSYRTTEAA